jgi:flagellar assembly protein FliH
MASIIKANDRVRAANAAPFELGELADAATGLFGDDRAQNDLVEAEAEHDARRIRRRAEDEGRAAALAVAEQILDEKVKGRLSTLLPAIRAAVDGVHAAKTQWLAHWEQAAMGVATAIAARVIRRELARAPEITLGLVREALELASGSGDVQLRLHPDDFETLGKQASQLADELARLGKVDILADASITKGGCRVDTRFGVIDQQLEAQLARIEQELT